MRISGMYLAVAIAQAGQLQPNYVPNVASAPTIAIVGGLNGPDAASEAIRSLPHTAYNLYTIPVANPDGAKLVFPPTGTPYRENAQSHYIWRWLGLHAPDLVIIVGREDYGLASALALNKVAGLGSIPALRVDPEKVATGFPKEIAKSEAHIEHDRRLSRTPRQVAEELAAIYGHDFDPPVYIPAMSLIARLRLGQEAEVANLVAPYIDGRKDSVAKITSSHLAGHLIFAEMAERTGDKRYIERVRAAAGLALPLHNEMSDAVFMGCPILSAAGKLTGKSTYYDQALESFRFMRKLCLRPDGLYRHSPLNDAAWGRGNAFPALGMSWTLLNLPTTNPAFAEMRQNFKALIATLAKFQDADGMWHEVIDRPDSYPEFSATAMITTAMIRGLKQGWLDDSYQPRVKAAWRGILTRIGPGGALIDVCESTGKQKTLEDYLNRAASSGKDARGGGMALLHATEMQ